MLDTYNQQIQEGVSCTILTNINTANHHFVVMEEPKIIEVGKLNEGRHQQDFVQHEDGICRTICTGHHASTPHLLKTMVSEPISVAMRGRNPNNPSERGKSNGNYKQRLEMNKSGVANTITSVQKDSMVAEPLHIPEATAQGYAEAYEGDAINLAVPNSKTRRGRVGKQMANTLDCGCQQGVVEKEKDVRYRIRKLTPRECFRLMGVDDADIDKIQASGISNSQQYKLAGNSIVVDVSYHLFRKMFCETENEQQQMTLF